MPNTTLKRSSKVAENGNQSKSRESKSTIPFTAKLTRSETTGKLNDKSELWSVLALPKSASAKLPSRETTMVEGTMNGFPFRAALEPDDDGGHRLKVNRALRDAVGADVDDEVNVEITRVGDEPECRVPAELRKAIEADATARASWADITPMARRDWVLSIISVKQEETRKRRIEITLDMLSSGKRRPCCFPGINWRRKDSEVTSEETWQPLPGAKGRSSAKSTK